MTRKDIKQQIASAQERLYFLEAKKKQQTKKENTRQKIIFGAEVAKVLGCDIGYVDKELVFGILLDIPNLHESDIEGYRAQGQVYIESVLNKSKQ
ncbi:conjugal transfer protein TraD [Pectobacterium parmentieri]|uniref:Conjugal transfer protein TraD n=1 Tax=Pectobacterium versatile TaxID=2488639 RepID=A0AAW3RSQ9_9GAMM|nr:MULTISPECIES: conjugal transfer protein TraD [Pectobacterium]AVT59739.1 Conjugal transfer TraD family protein [Pectobacterium versatile]AZK62361.1 conjugal transfer protein TraD [Pectobacterium versatile]MBA0159440.1 conjugal transfer protein TraD [Pectobacterium versatile]MBA0187113.1 conjugal transfer protein TraD [Pectobacterium odoriferum]MBD0848741.1 conjugal transfer protein TraD [Pectobacterium carotovorum subsp. carotovorum]